MTVDDIDAKNAGTLLVGDATATKVEIADAGIETEIQGTLDVQQAAEFSSTATTVNGGAFQGKDIL